MKQLSERLIACSLSASIYSSYIPLDRISMQIARAAATGNADKLERLFAVLSDKYPPSSLIDCLTLPDPMTRKPPLIRAAEQGLLEIVNWLVSTGTEDGGLTKTPEGDTILHIAAAHESPDIIALYHANLQNIYDDEEAGVRFVDWPNAQGASPLCIACQKGSLEAVVTLLSLGASIDIHDNDGNTPLHHAASFGHREIIARLLHVGASAFTKNNNGYNASDVAFSFEVEQEIQNTVRSALEASRRARNAKGSNAASSSLRRHASHREYDDVSDGDEEEESAEGLASSGPALVTSPGKSTMCRPLILASRTAGLQLQTSGLGPATPQLPTTPIMGPNSATLFSANTTPGSSHRTALRDLPQPSPSLADPEASKALQRIFARDHNAQSGFQASTAYKELVGLPFAPPAMMGMSSTTASSSPYSVMSKESGYFTSHSRPSAVDMKRERSASSTGVASIATGSSFSTTASGLITSPVDAPVASVDAATMPHTAVPILGSPARFTPRELKLPLATAASAGPHVSGTASLPGGGGGSASSVASPLPRSSAASSFVGRLKRSGSSGLPSPCDPLSSSKNRDKALPVIGGKGLRHHASLADLREESVRAERASTDASRVPPLPTPALPKSAFTFGKSRTRSGT